MEAAQPAPRKVPLLASIVSVVFGFGSLVALLGALHAMPSWLDVNQPVHQPIALRIAYILMQALVLAGSVLLWKMKPLAGKLFLASFVMSLASLPLVHSTRPIPFATNFIGFALQAAIVAYVWWVTARWQATQPVAPQT
jgi:hypothetical protein